MARTQFTFTFRNGEPGAVITFSADVYASKTAQNPEGPALVLDQERTVAVWSDASELIATWVDGAGVAVEAEASLAFPIVIETGGTAGASPAPSGGSSTVQLHKAPFAFDTVGLATGADLVFSDGYTPQVGDYLINVWVEVDEGFDGTTPLGMITTVPTPSTVGLLTYGADLTSVDTIGQGGGVALLNNYVSNPLTNGSPSRVRLARPIKICVNQTGTIGQWPTVQAVDPITLPVTVTAGVNDEFTYTPIATGTPETFTIAPGVYATEQACADALAAAVGVTAERFDTIALVLTVGVTLEFMLLDGPGTAHDGDLIGSGAHDAATTFGFPPPGPYTFSGAAVGADSTPTRGSGHVAVLVLRP